MGGNCFGNSFKYLFIIFLLLFITIITALAWNEAIKHWIAQRVTDGNEAQALFIYAILVLLLWLLLVWIFSRWAPYLDGSGCGYDISDPCDPCPLKKCCN